MAKREHWEEGGTSARRSCCPPHLCGGGTGDIRSDVILSDCLLTLKKGKKKQSAIIRVEKLKQQFLHKLLSFLSTKPPPHFERRTATCEGSR